MNILAIESSCDETAAAIISGDPLAAKNTKNLSTNNPSNSNNTLNQATPQILSNVVVSQIDIFKAYGGVIPEVAARSHLEAILPVIHQAFKEAGFIKKTSTDPILPTDPIPNPNLNQGLSTNQPKASEIDDWSKIDAIAVTHTPGLLGSLLIGTLTARTLAILHHKPLYAVHHLKSHIYANWLNTEATEYSPSDTASNAHPTPTSTSTSASTSTSTSTSTPTSASTPTFPLLALVISGGHTQIIRMTAHNNFEIIGTTLDDAVGECFDKVAKILGLPYPGGPSIAKCAEAGDPKKYHLPIPNIKNLDFSFSGLKTAVLRAVQKEVGVPISYPSHQLASLLTSQQKADFAASFQHTAIEILLRKLKKAVDTYPDTKSIVIAGGVAANQKLREAASKRFISLNFPTPSSPALNFPTPSSPAPNSPTPNSSIPNSPIIFFPELKFSGDNAAMVGAAAFYEIASDVTPTDPYTLNIYPRSTIK